jgi:hypothetical protein
MATPVPVVYGGRDGRRGRVTVLVRGTGRRTGTLTRPPYSCLS